MSSPRSRKNPELKDRAVEKGKLNPLVASAWLSMVVETQVAQEAVQKAGTKISKADQVAARRWADGYFGAPAAFAAFPQSFRETALARYANVPAYVRTHTKPPTEKLVRAAYDSSLVKNCASKRYVSHILVKDQATAQAVETELAGGADFTKVAKKRSTDTQSAQRGGALGCIDGQQVDPKFTAAADATAVGQVSVPVQTQFGWHVIKVEDVSKAIPFDDVKGEIRADLTEQGPEGIAKLQKLVAKAKVKVASQFGRWVVKDGKGAVQPLTTTPSSGPGPTGSSSSTSSTTTP